jgi:hypothetical protein
MPKYAVQPQWRSRRAAIGKKCEVDYALLMESELDFSAKKSVEVPTSPISITAFDFPSVPEMKPLPGAWVTIGKGGRPVKESLMYDEPAKLWGKKKKKRARARKATTSEYDPVVEVLMALEDMPSSSKCVHALDRSTMLREKAVLKGKEIKFWRSFNEAKMLKVLARDSLIAALADDGMLGESEAGVEEHRKPKPLKTRHDKGSSRSARMRRKARFAAAAERCYSVEMEEEMIEVQVKGQAQASSRSPVDKAANGWVSLAKAVAESESEVDRESEVSSTDTESLSAKQTKQIKEKRSSKQCIVS